MSRRPRLPYLFLRGARTTRGTVTWDQIVSHGGLLVLGDEKFLARQLEGVQRMASEASYSFRQRDLTPGYHDVEGHKIVQVFELTANAKSR